MKSRKKDAMMFGMEIQKALLKTKLDAFKRFQTILDGILFNVLESAVTD